MTQRESYIQDWRHLLLMTCGTDQPLDDLVENANDVLDDEANMFFHEEPAYWLVRPIMKFYGYSGPLSSPAQSLVLTALSQKHPGTFNYYDPQHNWVAVRRDLQQLAKLLNTDPSLDGPARSPQPQ